MPDSEAAVNCFDVVDIVTNADAALFDGASSSSSTAAAAAEGGVDEKSRTRFCAHSREVKAMWIEMVRQQCVRVKEQMEVQRQRQEQAASLMAQRQGGGLNGGGGGGGGGLGLSSLQVSGGGYGASSGSGVGGCGGSPRSGGDSRLSTVDLEDMLADIGSANNLSSSSSSSAASSSSSSSQRMSPRLLAARSLLAAHATFTRRLSVVVVHLALPLQDISRGATKDGVDMMGAAIGGAVGGLGVDSGSGGAGATASSGRTISSSGGGGRTVSSSGGAGVGCGGGGGIQGTTTTLGVMGERIKRAVSRDLVALLQRPDVLVFLQTLVDLNHENTTFVSDLHERIKRASSSASSKGSGLMGEGVDIGTINHPFNERLFETFAWAFGAARKVLLESGSAFAELVAATDLQLQASEAKATTNQTNQSNSNNTALVVTVEGVLGSFLADSSLPSALRVENTDGLSQPISDEVGIPSALGSVLGKYAEILRDLLRATTSTNPGKKC